MKGKRKSFVEPFKLFLVISVIYFLLLQRFLNICLQTDISINPGFRGPFEIGLHKAEEVIL